MARYVKFNNDLKETRYSVVNPDFDSGVLSVRIFMLPPISGPNYPAYIFF